MWICTHMTSRVVQSLLRNRKHLIIWMKSVYSWGGFLLVIPEARIETIQLRVVITTFLFIKIKIQLLSVSEQGE